MGCSIYLLREVKSIMNLNFFYFLGTKPACAHTSDVSFGSSLWIMPCFSRSSSNCFACALICSGIARGLKRYSEGSNLLDKAFLRQIHIGGHFMNLSGLRVLLKRDLNSLINFCSYWVLVLIRSCSCSCSLIRNFSNLSKKGGSFPPP